MLYREDTPQGRIAITQPAHAWVSGQLARAWGNEFFGEIAPKEDVCLGAEQHDIGHTAWEQEPRLNPQTGLPYDFLSMPRQWHLEIWSSAARMVLPQGRYAALLVSLHGTGLYRDFDIAKDTAPEHAQAIQNYLKHEQAFQKEVLASLRQDPHYSACATDEAVERNRQLVRVWDAFSLIVGFGRRQERTLQRVPTATGDTTLTLTPHTNFPTHLVVTPWPFRRQQVTLVYEGRCLNETFSDEKTMREVLRRAPYVTLQTTLLPG